MTGKRLVGPHRIRNGDLMASAAPNVLVVVGDSELAANADRIAAAVGARAVVTSHPGGRAWLGAAAVVVDVDGARRCVGAGLPRREGVVLVASAVVSPSDWALAVELGAARVCELPHQETDLVRFLAEAGDSAGNSGRSGPVVAVAGGRGGAGASVFSAAVALAAVASTPAESLLMDLDPGGGGLDLLLGAESAPGLRWPDLGPQKGRLSWPAVRDALPGPAGVSILSGTRQFHDIDSGAVAAVVEAARRAGSTVVCDIPRQLTPAGASAVQRADLVVVLATCDVRSIAATGATTAMLRSINPALGLVVRGPAPGGLRARDVADAASAPLLASMRPEPMLAQRLERGGLRLRRRSPLAQAARTVLGILPRKSQVRAA